MFEVNYHQRSWQYHIRIHVADVYSVNSGSNIAPCRTPHAVLV